LRFAEPRAQPPALAGVLAWQGAGQEWTAVCRGRPGELAAAMADSGAHIVADRVPSLDEIFLAQVGTARALAARED
jgi:ABC-2 type transport system ATP-binding protein